MTAPRISALPTPPNVFDPATFGARATSFLGAFPTLRTQINAFADYIDTFSFDVGSAGFVAGSAVAPSVRSQAEQGNGVFFPAGAVAFASGGIERFRTIPGGIQVHGGGGADSGTIDSDSYIDVNPGGGTVGLRVGRKTGSTSRMVFVSPGTTTTRVSIDAGDGVGTITAGAVNAASATVTGAFAAGTVAVGAAGSMSAPAVRLDAGVGIYRSSGMPHVAVAGAAVARFDSAGTGAGSGLSVITREKGDARYARPNAENGFTATQAHVGSHFVRIRSERSDADAGMTGGVFEFQHNSQGSVQFTLSRRNGTNSETVLRLHRAGEGGINALAPLHENGSRVIVEPGDGLIKTGNRLGLNLSAGAVGMPALMRNDTGGNVNTGENVPGSSLRYSDAGGSLGSSPFAGSVWKCASRTADGNVGLFVRIS
jgi:hypothetical protein